MLELLSSIGRKVIAFKQDVDDLLSKHEASKSRVISVDKTRRMLAGLSLQQDELFQQAILCVERGIHRAAHVMSWAAFVDYLEEKLASDGLVKVMSKRPAWAKYSTVEELRENIPEYQLIEAARDVGLLSKSQTKTILGLLSKRNECAHPSGHNPGLNESLGFISELLTRVEQLQKKSL